MKKHLLPPCTNRYKANLHCHSTVSDGRLSPEELKRVYSEQGYSIIAFTDHDLMLPHHDLTDEGFLALTGYEMEINQNLPEGADGARHKTCHLCLIALDPTTERQVCWHREKYLFAGAVALRDMAKFDPSAPDYVREYTPACINDMIKKGRDAGFFVTYNHPAWSLESAEDWLAYEGMNAMKICNFASVEEGFEDYVPYIYDEMLRAGKRIYCIGADDNHNGTSNPVHDSFGAFTVICAERLDYRTVTTAMERGEMYASCGPEIRELYVEDGKVHLSCSDASGITVAFDNRHNKAIWAPEGRSLNGACFTLPSRYGYFRLTVLDGQGRAANTRAYFSDEI